MRYLIIVLLLLFGCEGEQGIKGITGEGGEQGIPGEQGSQGEIGFTKIVLDVTLETLIDSRHVILNENIHPTSSIQLMQEVSVDAGVKSFWWILNGIVSIYIAEGELRIHDRYLTSNNLRIVIIN